MSRALHAAILATLMIALVSSPAGAVTVPGCINPAYSALNEYCEVLPGATGAKPPAPGTPTLAGAIPLRAAEQIARDPALRVLVGLPAPAKHAANSAARVAQGSVKPGSSSLPGWEFALLAALGLTLMAAAVAGRWRRRPRANGLPG